MARNRPWSALSRFFQRANAEDGMNNPTEAAERRSRNGDAPPLQEESVSTQTGSQDEDRSSCAIVRRRQTAAVNIDDRFNFPPDRCGLCAPCKAWRKQMMLSWCKTETRPRIGRILCSSTDGKWLSCGKSAKENDLTCEFAQYRLQDDIQSVADRISWDWPDTVLPSSANSILTARKPASSHENKGNLEEERQSTKRWHQPKYTGENHILLLGTEIYSSFRLPNKPTISHLYRAAPKRIDQTGTMVAIATTVIGQVT
ncbi:hypothetical protein EJ04DRAFT_508220 [Polyplosphaeria fusca]|uniref:Uncharacterized protein n=1 Tax=Polyplosphaeria fusca TaxID=682080 RepID=A0A9P4RBX7_9PLEO|nr:hypothetical protein EJ04DRAFT_508220 [Polyplosphaeria fusca]